MVMQWWEDFAVSPQTLLATRTQPSDNGQTGRRLVSMQCAAASSLNWSIRPWNANGSSEVSTCDLLADEDHAVKYSSVHTEVSASLLLWRRQKTNTTPTGTGFVFLVLRTTHLSITLCRLAPPPQQAARRVMGTHGDHNTSSFFNVRLLGHHKLVLVPHGHVVEGGGGGG